MIFEVCYTAAKMLKELTKYSIQWIESRNNYPAVSQSLETLTSYLDSTIFRKVVSC